MNCNVYDFDKTIYKKDSSIDFYCFCYRRHLKLIKYLPIQIYSTLLYLLKRINKTAYKERMFLFIKDISLNEEVKLFWERHEKDINNWYLLQKEKTDIIISASPDFLIAPIGKILNVAKVIATNIDIKTGKFMSPNCHDQEKVVRFKKECPNTYIEKFYSDSKSDTPMALLAKQAFLVKNNTLLPWTK